MKSLLSLIFAKVGIGISLP